jgi:hypothetical protein
MSTCLQCRRRLNLDSSDAETQTSWAMKGGPPDRPALSLGRALCWAGEVAAVSPLMGTRQDPARVTDSHRIAVRGDIPRDEQERAQVASKAYVWSPWRSAYVGPDRVAVTTDDGDRVTYAELVDHGDRLSGTSST